MAKFGEIINSEVPVLIQFYDDEPDDVKDILNNIASDITFSAKLIKIDINKNPKMAEALRLRHFPTYMIYKNGEMKWRQSGEMNPVFLINTLKRFTAS